MLPYFTHHSHTNPLTRIHAVPFYTQIKAIEDAVDLGQVEEVIEMVKDEMISIDNYVDNKMWDVVAEAQRDADEVLASMGDVVYFTDPKNKAGKPK